MWRGCALAILMVTLAAGLRIGLLPVLGLRSPYLTFYPAVVITALYGGRAAGLLATLLSALTASFLWIAPVGHLTVADRGDWLGLVVFVLGGTAVSWICEAMHRAQARAGEAEAQVKIAMERQRAAEELREQREWLRVTLSSIGDAVLATDTVGGITFLNPVAARLTGWTEQEALDRAAREVFRTIDEQTREELPDLVERVLREGRAAALANHTALVNREGREIPIEDSAAPILDSGGNVTGVVLVFRDVTEKRRAAEELQRSEEHLRVAATAADIGVWYRTGTSGLSVNATWKRLFGVLPDAPVTLDTWREALHPDDRDRTVKGLNSAIEQGREFELEYRIVRPDGSVRWIAGQGRASYDGNGQITGLAGVSRDITERKQTEEALRTSEERYRGLFENMSEGFAYCRMVFENGEPVDFVYLAVNEAFGVLTGLKDVIGKKVAEVIPGIRETNPELLRICGRVSLSGVPERFETFVEPLGGWFSVSVYSPEQECFVAIFDVITERKRVEAALRESEERFRGMAEQMVDVLFTTDSTGVITYVSPAAMQVSGWAPEKMTGLPVTDVVQKEEIPRVLEAFDAALNRGETIRGLVLNMKRADGSAFSGEVNGAAIRKDGAVVGLMGITRDITAIIRAEEEKRRLEAQLQHSQRLESIGRLAGGIAHDFNNLLTVINGHSALALERLAEDDPLWSGLAEIHHAGEQAATLTRQLVAFSRKEVIEPRPVDCNDLLAGNRDMFQRLAGGGVKLSIISAPSLAHVVADPSQLTQVLMNLVANAKDAMPHGGTLEIETANLEVREANAEHPGITPGCYVLVTVRDNGIGMDRESQEHIFEPFFTTKPAGTGTGIGLATAYSVVRQCGGGSARRANRAAALHSASICRLRPPFP
jgi:PAS domain S-box-containing protein